MPRVKVKFCGLTDATAIAEANALGVDMVGFVFHPPSPRHLDEVEAARLAALLDAKIERVALLVDPDDDEIARVMRAIGAHRIQLHGAETPSRVAAIKAQSHCAIIKAVGVATQADLAGARDYAEAADWLLLDAKPAAPDALTGGNGVAFDWGLLAGQELPYPWLLSGGLTPDNVGDAIAQTRATMVDVSSGIEAVRGRKNPDLMRAFMAECEKAGTGI